jgi:NADH-quinone oxidoreductase subunit N
LIRVFSSLGSGSDLKLASVVFSALALLTMVVGNLVALPQRNVKRMLAYSSIAHAGYLLLGVAALFAHPGAAQVGWQFLNATPLTSAASAAELARAGTLRGILFYLLAYTVTAAGAFGTLSALERREDEEKPTAWDIDRFSGLAQRRPGWAIAMAVFMLSLGGIPPTVGFIGKLLIFQSAVGAGLVGLVVIGILSSVAGAYYYLRVVVYMFMRPAEEGAPLPSRQWATEVALVLSTLAVLALGILPGIAIRWFSSAAALWAGP